MKTELWFVAFWSALRAYDACMVEYDRLLCSNKRQRFNPGTITAPSPQ